MSIAIRHIRSLLIAVVALAMSAGLTLGAAAPQASFGQARAFSNAGTTAGAGDALTAGEDEDADEGEDTSGDDEDADQDEETDEEEDADAEGDGGENCATDPTALETDLTTLTHGQIVCWAAHQETPEGYANHGAWVSEWAKGAHGGAAATKSKGKAKSHNKPE